MSHAGSPLPESHNTPITAPRDPLPRLILALQSNDSAEKLAALTDLSHLGSLATDSIPDLQRLLSDDDPVVRRMAARALGQMGTTAIPSLSDALEHTDKEVRRQAIWALARMATQATDVIASIGKALRDPDPRTASGAAQALVNMGAAAAPAVTDLLGSLQSNNLVQCRLVSKALSEIGAAALPELLERLNDPDPFVRREVAIAIGFMGPEARPAVSAIIEHLRAKVPTKPASCDSDFDHTRVTPIKATVAEPPDYRAILIDALARIGPAAAESREYLLATLNDPDRVVGQAAAQALLRIMGWN